MPTPSALPPGRSRSPDILDRIDAYARAAVDGSIPASVLVRAICERHLIDVERSGARPGAVPDPDCWFGFSRRRAVEALKSVSQRIIYNKRSGRFERLRLQPWQIFFVGSLFGWVIRPGVRDPKSRAPGTRRIRKASLLTGRASGKSITAAAIAVYVAILHNRRTDGYIVAGTEKQAGIILGYIQQMARTDPWLDSISKSRKGSARQGGGEIEFRCPEAGIESRIQSIAGMGAKRQSGYHPTLLICDEVQEHANELARSNLEGGFGDEPEPLALNTANAGRQRRGAWWDDRLQARAILADPRSHRLDDCLPLIYEIDEDDDPLEEHPELPGEYTEGAERAWTKSNPSYRVVIGPDVVKREIEKAKAGGTDKLRELYRAQFSRAPSGSGTWISEKKWDAIQVGPEGRPDEAILRESLLFAALDLARKGDLTALALVWQLPREHGAGLYAELAYYTNAEQLEELARVCQADFLAWADPAKTPQRGAFGADACAWPAGQAGRDGQPWRPRALIRTTPSDMLDYRAVIADLADLKERYRLHGVAVDRYDFKSEFLPAAEDAGTIDLREVDDPKKGSARQSWIAWYDHLQGAKWYKRGVEEPLSMRRSLTLFDARLADPPQIRILLDPMTSFCFTCVTVDRPLGHGQSENNRWLERITKHSGREKIDGCVALAMAVGLADYRRKPKRSNIAELEAAFARGYQGAAGGSVQ